MATEGISLKSLKDLKLIQIIAMSAILRLLPLAWSRYPSGQDITLLGDMARLYLHAWETGQSYPRSWEYLFAPIDILTFHSLLAPAVALAEKIFPGSMLVSLKFISCIGFVIYDLAAFLFLDTLVPRQRKFVFITWLLVCFGSPVPARFFGSGGGAFVFSLGLMVFSITLLLQNLRNNSCIKAALGGVILLVSFLIHPIPAVFAPFLALASLVGAWDLWRGNHQKTVCKNLSAYTVSALPIATFVRAPDPTVLKYVEDWLHYVRETYSSISGLDVITKSLTGIVWELASFPGFLIKQFGWIGLTVTFICGRRMMVNPERRWLEITLIFALFVWIGSHLPLIGPALYPDRGAALIVLLFGVPAVRALAATWEQSQKGVQCFYAVKKTLWIGCALGLMAISSRYIWNYTLQPIQNGVMSQDDEDVIHNISKIIPPNEWILTNYYDAGVWIPSLIGYTVTEPHTHFTFEAAWQQRKKLAPNPLYKYQGSRCTAGLECPVSCTDSDETLIRHGNAILCRRTASVFFP
jgi:hypothetical protein